MTFPDTLLRKLLLCGGSNTRSIRWVPGVLVPALPCPARLQVSSLNQDTLFFSGWGCEPAELDGYLPCAASTKYVRRTCQARRNVRCQGCRAERSTPNPSIINSLVSVKASQAKSCCLSRAELDGYPICCCQQRASHVTYREKSAEFARGWLRWLSSARFSRQRTVKQQK